VAVDSADGLFLEIAGCGHLFGGEPALVQNLLDHMARFGFAARASVASTPGAAWALARFGAASPAVIEADIPLGAALGGLPIAALRLSAAHVAELRRLGLKTIAQLDALPRAALTTRFGAGVARRLDQAFGRDFEPLAPGLPADPDRLRMAFAEPVRDREAIAAVLEDLLAKLCARLVEKGRGARRLDFTLYRTDGSTAVASVGTSRPAAEPRHLARLFAEKLDRLDPGFGADVIALAAPLSEPFAPAQTTHLKGAADATAMSGTLAPLVDRLDNRLGSGAVARFSPVDSHVPERAVARRAPFSPSSSPTTPSADKAAARAPHARTGARTPPPWPARGPRPLRLFDPPEPVDAVAPVPDDPPVMFRWRRVIHRVARADGPERIAPEWWRALKAPKPDQSPDQASDRGEDAATTRDYYRVEDTEGRRFWLYRHGLFRPGVAPAWFVHGLFG
jgi:protein ImuB